MTRDPKNLYDTIRRKKKKKDCDPPEIKKCLLWVAFPHIKYCLNNEVIIKVFEIETIQEGVWYFDFKIFQKIWRNFCDPSCQVFHNYKEKIVTRLRRQF